MITVLIIDDSATARLALRKALEKSPDLSVVGEASSPEAAMRLIPKLDPKIVTMDVHLGQRNGIELTEQIMSECPRPVVVVTGVNPTSPELIYRALQAGALEVVGKLPAPDRPEYPERQRRLVRLITSLAAVPVVTRGRRRRLGEQRAPVLATPRRAAGAGGAKIVVIGASTGGPPALAELLGVVPSPSPWPVVVVQHIGAGFGRGFAAWLNAVTPHEVVLVTSELALESGRVYVADGDRHARITSQRRVVSERDPPSTCRPSVDILFESAAEHFGAGAVAVLLTGMGHDGVEGLRALARKGATTLAQRPETCVVAGMPQAAIDAGVVDQVGTVAELGQLLAGQYP